MNERIAELCHNPAYGWADLLVLIGNLGLEFRYTGASFIGDPPLEAVVVAEMEQVILAHLGDVEPSPLVTPPSEK